MKRTAVWVLSLAVAGIGLGGCEADDSAPNVRGVNRPNLLDSGQKEQENASKRVEEAPKREMPTAGKEFPGQSRLNPGNDQVLTLADLGTQPATTEAGQETTYVKGGIKYVYVGNQWVAATAVPGEPAALTPTTTPMPTALAADRPKPSVERIDDNRPWAVPGKVMVVPGTGGEVIPADWGQVKPLADYPHRPWPNTETRYINGAVHHNPVYWTNLFPIEYDPTAGYGTWGGNQFGSNVQDLVGIAWFYGESVAVPVLMVIDLPLAQRTTSPAADDKVYHGYLPVTGRVDPAPVPGEIKYVYPFTATQPNPALNPPIPAPFAPPPTTQP